MGFNDALKRNKDGSYILKHKTKEARLKGECIECGQNPSSRDLLYKYKADDMMLVRNHIEEHLTAHPKHKSVTPQWCNKCNTLIKYLVRIV
jgi:hypothetical protein